MTRVQTYVVARTPVSSDHRVPGIVTSVSLSRPFWLLFTISFLGIVSLAVLLTVTLNISAVHSSEALFDTVIEDRQDRWSALALETGYWDQAVENLVEKVDMAWADENIGSYLNDQGVSQAYVLDSENRTVIANIDGELDTAASLFAPGRFGLEGLVEAARQTEDDAAPVPAKGILIIDGVYHFAAAVRMTTYTTDLDISTDHVLVLTEAVDEQALSDISARYLMPELSLEDSPPAWMEAGAPATVAGQQPTAFFRWQPDLPGKRFFPYLLAGVLIAFSVMFVAAILFVRRSAAIMQSLTEAHEAANRANKAKSEFLQYVSHELRSPVNAMVGFAQLMHSQPYGALGHAKYLEYLKDIEGAGDHVVNLVSDLLDLEKIEAGEMSFDVQPVDVRGPLEEALSFVWKAAADKSISLVVEGADEAVVIKSDRRMLKQMLTNLVSNAVKFTPSNGVVTCRLYRSGDDRVAVEVVDTGMGLTPEQIDRALQPFGQVSNNQPDGVRSTGLGLPITRKLVEILGGEFQFESVVNQGTRATIILPIGA